MEISKHLVVAKLRQRGLDIRADWVDKQLPEKIDPTVHGGLLATLHLRVEDLIEDETPSTSDSA
jgi:hypothetical protein